MYATKKFKKRPKNWPEDLPSPVDMFESKEEDQECGFVFEGMDPNHPGDWQHDILSMMYSGLYDPDEQTEQVDPGLTLLDNHADTEKVTTLRDCLSLSRV